MAQQHIIELNGKRYDAVTGKMIATHPLAASPQKSTPKPLKKASVDGFARPIKPLVSRPMQKSKTLMRKTVHKPVAAKPAPKSVQTFQGASSNKLAHAKAVTKSALVRKFNDVSGRPTAHTESMPVPGIDRVHVAPTAVSTTKNPIEAGLAKAVSHEQPKLKRLAKRLRVGKHRSISPRLLSGGSMLLAAMLVGGFFAYQNIPNLNMRLASTRAGIQGSLPAYKPAGFALHGGIAYKPGQIVFGYKSTSDNRNFKITQERSSWNSDTLVENYDPLKNSSSRIASQEKGKTLYIYNDSNATWVDGGIWYRIEGESQLNSDQLRNIADSL